MEKQLRVLNLSLRKYKKIRFIALNNVLLNYTFDSRTLSNMGLSGLSLFASGDNLMYKTARQGFLPTTSQSGNSGRALYAPLTTFTVGVRAKF